MHMHVYVPTALRDDRNAHARGSQKAQVTTRVHLIRPSTSRGPAVSGPHVHVPTVHRADRTAQARGAQAAQVTARVHLRVRQ
jgi:hypothetical protein